MTGENMNFELRRLGADALSELLAIERRCFADPWSEQLFSEALASDFMHFTGICREDGKLCGFVAFSLSVFDDGGECEIYDLAVLPEKRRGGLGRELVLAAVRSAEVHGADSIYLEVRETNTAARGLYDSLGFKEYGRRKNYYSSPREDAVLMSLKLDLHGSSV